MKKRGFTLLETLLAFSLAATILILTFSAWNRANESKRRLEGRMLGEFSLYRTMDAVREVTAGMSRTHFPLKMREPGPYFRGSPRSVTFITRIPLTAALPGLHLLQLEWDGKRLVEKEIRFNPDLDESSIQRDPAVRGCVLLSGVSSCRFYYLAWDHRKKKWEWLDELNTNSGRTLPSAIALEMTWKNETRRFEFRRFLIDEDETISPSLLP